MSETVSFKVPKRIKDEMNRLKNRVDWPEELRKHVIDVIKRIKRDFNEVIENLKKLGLRMYLKASL
ncbi:CopG family transcriptional regulator [Candidatus Bathyarchaeota archaeon]|nr:CopG family transcriptional regulator [Candidatus Bathyarchaeota archaeon]